MPENNERTYYVLCDDNCRFEGMTKEQIINAIVQATGVEPQDIDQGFITKVLEQNQQNNLKFWVGTEAQYNAISTKANDILYIIKQAGKPLLLYGDLEEKATEVATNVATEVTREILEREIFSGLIKTKDWTISAFTLDGNATRTATKAIGVTNWVPMSIASWDINVVSGNAYHTKVLAVKLIEEQNAVNIQLANSSSDSVRMTIGLRILYAKENISNV